MKFTKVFSILLIASYGVFAQAQESQGIGLAIDSPSLIMEVTKDGEVRLYEAQGEDLGTMSEQNGRVVYLPVIASASNEDLINQLGFDNDELLALFSGENPENSSMIISPMTNRYVPGSQGSNNPAFRLSTEEEKSIINALSSYASAQALDASRAFCEEDNNYRPESVSIAAGGTPLQVSVSWNVSQVCEVHQREVSE